MIRNLLVAALFFPVPLCAQRPAARPAAQYFPDRFDWQHRRPADVGMDSALIAAAVAQAQADSSRGLRDQAAQQARTFGREPHGDIIGPMKERGPQGGIIVRHGYIVAEWGEPARVDMTHSVTKTFLSTVVGLAWDRGLVRDVHDKAAPYMPGSEYWASAHNDSVTWENLLQQNSDWQGTLWDKPDWADRPRGEKPEAVARATPGTAYEYNDVRVNMLSLLALNVWRRPLPQVLREEIMEPIGASNTWRWEGYQNSWVDLDGQWIQSVSGGGHWGGGMFISAYDMARFGLLFLRNGKWKDRQLISEKWIQMARTPSTPQDTYGYMNWFLNTAQKELKAAPATAVRFVGNGNNIIYVDWDNDIVAVFRWINGSGNASVEKMLASLKSAPALKP